MTAAELLRTALAQSHRDKLSVSEDTTSACLFMDERDRFESAMQAVDKCMTDKERMGLEAAVFALAGVDP